MTQKKERKTQASVKHFDKMTNLYNVYGRHLISKNSLPSNWEGYYAYSRVGGKLCLFIVVRNLLLLSRHKNHPIHTSVFWQKFAKFSKKLKAAHL
jgi:hypothetical protein